MIDQKMLRRLLRQQRRLKRLHVMLHEQEREYQTAAAEVIRAIYHGDPIEPGRIAAAVRVAQVRRVAWKRVLEAKLGQDEVARILSATPQTEKRHLVLTVRGR